MREPKGLFRHPDFGSTGFTHQFPHPLLDPLGSSRTPPSPGPPRRLALDVLGARPPRFVRPAGPAVPAFASHFTPLPHPPSPGAPTSGATAHFEGSPKHRWPRWPGSLSLYGMNDLSPTPLPQTPLSHTHTHPTIERPRDSRSLRRRGDRNRKRSPRDIVRPTWLHVCTHVNRTTSLSDLSPSSLHYLSPRCLSASGYRPLCLSASISEHLSLRLSLYISNEIRTRVATVKG